MPVAGCGGIVVPAVRGLKPKRCHPELLLRNTTKDPTWHNGSTAKAWAPPRVRIAHSCASQGALPVYQAHRERLGGRPAPGRRVGRTWALLATASGRCGGARPRRQAAAQAAAATDGHPPLRTRAPAGGRARGLSTVAKVRALSPGRRPWPVGAAELTASQEPSGLKWTVLAACIHGVLLHPTFVAS
jgi:hypothetical protein